MLFVVRWVCLRFVVGCCSLSVVYGALLLVVGCCLLFGVCCVVVVC